MKNDPLRRGDVVEVRRADQILATLDGGGALDALPFMPEMLQFCGQRFVVTSRADKVCTVLWGPMESRQLAGTVLLENLRCDGASHGGCESNCRLFWKEAWLRPVRADDPADNQPEDLGTRQRLAELAAHNTQKESGEAAESNPCFRCQASELCTASTPLRTTDPRPYLREFTSKDVPLRRFVRVMARAVRWHVLHKLGVSSHLYLRGTGTSSPPSEPLHLQPGDWVKVKSREGIAATLTDKSTNRGLFFDMQMLNYSGKVFRVEKRVTRIISPDSGRLIHMTRDCVILENVACSGDYSLSRWFCPRADQPFWRECWLERAATPLSEMSGS